MYPLSSVDDERFAQVLKRGPKAESSVNLPIRSYSPDDLDCFPDQTAAGLSGLSIRALCVGVHFTEKRVDLQGSRSDLAERVSAAA